MNFAQESLAAPQPLLPPRCTKSQFGENEEVGGMSNEKLAALTKRLDSYATSAQGFLKDVTKARANVEQLKAFQDRATEISGCFDDHELVEVATGELAALEVEFEEFVEAACFRDTAECEEPPELPPLAEDTTYRDHPIVWRAGSLDLEFPKNWPTCETPAALSEVLGKLRALESYTWRKLITDHSEQILCDNEDVRGLLDITNRRHDKPARIRSAEVDTPFRY